LSHLLWLCRLLSPYSSRARILEILPPRIAWEEVIALASVNGFLQSIHPALEDHGLCGLAPPEVQDALKEFHTQTVLRRREAAGQIERLSLLLNDARIEPVWLKGAGMIVRDSRWAARRFMSDLDFWVPPAQVQDAEAALRGQGYANHPRYLDPAEHHLAALHREGEPLMVEIHFGIAPPKVAAMLPLGRVLGRARRLEWRGARILVLHPADEAIHIASQARPSAARYLRGRLSVRRVCEFVQIAAEVGAAVVAVELRAACADAHQEDFAEEFLVLAGALFQLPGEFAFQGALEGFAWKTSFPRLHSLYFGYQGLSRRGLAYHLMHPREFAMKFARHVRHSMNPDW
jgi:hypothetical protein